MRLASRVIGILLVISALGCFAILGYVTVTEARHGATVAIWVGNALFLAAGVGLILGGRYYLRLDPDAPEQVRPASPPTEFLVIHRRQINLLAQVGLALSAIRLGGACFGVDWPGRWADWPLVLLLAGILYVGRAMAKPDVSDDRDWMRVPGWIRRSLPQVYVSALWSAMLLIVLSQWSHLVTWPALQSLAESSIYRLIVRALYLVCVTTLYAVAVLFLTYGELRGHQRKTAA